jgi:hypothetical protein
MTGQTALGLDVREGSGDYNTPLEWVIPIARCIGGFDLDPCASEDSDLADTNIREQGGLQSDWSQYRTVWLNHPYGRGESEKWLGKACEHKYDCETIVALSKADPSTEWFDRYVWGEASVICYPNSNRNGGRISFVGSDNGADFPVMYSVYGHCPDSLYAHFQRWGPTQ